MNLEHTYWGKKIEAARKRGRFTQSNKNQAETWQTCACSRQDRRLVDDDSCPLDSKLRNLGVNFFWDVYYDRFDAAYKHS